MENIKICELCQEQIIKTEDFENLNGDEKQNLIILKNLEINLSKDAKICSNCVNVSHLAYNFKTSCLTNNDHLKTLIHPGINEKLILEEIIVQKTKSELNNEEKVCRFCFNFSEVNLLLEVNLEQDVVLKDMLGRCLPEIDTNIVQNPLMCYTCSELLEKMFNFVFQSQNTEVLKNFDTKADVLVNENTSTVTVANNDHNTDKSFVKEENYKCLEEPEFQIKSEDFDTDEDIKHSINDSNCLLKENEICAKNPSFPSGLTHQQTHWKTRKSTIGKLYKCTKCSFESEYKRNIVRHKNSREEASKCNMCGFTACTKVEIFKHKKKVHPNQAEPKLFKCHKCPYITKLRSSLKIHNIRLHEDISKLSKYKCDECPYETLWKWRLAYHQLKHRDSSEVKMYKCMTCSFETKRKHTLQTHEKMHAKIQQNSVKVEQSLSNPVEEKDVKSKPPGRIEKNKFVSDICLFQTTTEHTLKQHYLIHKELSEVKVFKCDYCPYAARSKGNLTRHTKSHKNPLDLLKFKCNDCPYETNNKRNLISHCQVHKNPSQVRIYKCNDCPLETITKRNLVRHVLVHKNPSQVKMFKCNDCPFETNTKRNLVSHLLVHESYSQVKMFKCKVCPYQTKYSHTIQLHQKKHESEVYTCDKCSYNTKVKRCFVVHLQYHRE